jgi:hypothetical protein
MLWRITYTKKGSDTELYEDVTADTYTEAYCAVYYLNDTDTVIDVRVVGV